MKRTKSRLVAAAFIAGLVGGAAGIAQAAPFGDAEDTSYAALLWSIMEENKLAGPHAIHTFPYEGVEPHGAVLETIYTTATINGHTGDLVIKRNYGPAGVSIKEVTDNFDGHLGAITVMFRREDGYDADNANWFWVKYLPDGSLDKNPKGMELAGRVAKGADVGCLACHAGADGDDYLFTTNGIGMVK